MIGAAFVHGVFQVKIKNLFIAGGVLLLVAVVGLFPVFLSSGWIQDLFLTRVNNRIPGTISLESCSIGWQQELQCKSVSYHDEQKGIHVDIPKLSGSQGLLALVVAPMNLGTISLHDPVLVLPGLSSAVAKNLLLLPDRTILLQLPGKISKRTLLRPLMNPLSGIN